MTAKTIAKYLRQHAEAEARLPLDFAGHVSDVGHVVVIPAYGEGENLFATLASVPAGPLGETLIILVLNDRAESPDWVHRNNAAFARDFAHRFGPPENPAPNDLAPENLSPRKLSPIHLSKVPPVTLWRVPAGAIFLVERTTAANHPLPAGAGVGQARKVGADLALALIHRGIVASPWIHNTDADVLLPKDYFAHVGAAPPGTAACLHPFRHCLDADPIQARAMLEYEITLRHYVTGLAEAGSPYAFHTIGSTIAIHSHAYAAVRGFPQRNAAEDFYLLNKAAKTGTVARLPGLPLEIAGRLSDRVPFGTGKSLIRIVDQARLGEGYTTYDPILFRYLGVWLATLRRSVLDGVDPIGEMRDATQAAGLNADVVMPIVTSLEAAAQVAAIRARTRQPRQALRSVHEWFDAFRTLKFIHALRAAGYPSLPVPEALRRCSWYSAHASADMPPENAREGLGARLAILKRAEESLAPRITGAEIVLSPGPPGR